MIAALYSGGRRTAGLLAMAGTLSCALLVQAQSLIIPDFRQAPRETARGPRPGEACDRCGVIRSIREVRNQRPVPVPQTLQSSAMSSSSMGGDVRVGAVIALPTSEGGQSFVGGVGTPEMQDRFAETTYEITVRLDNGAFTMVQRRDGANYRVGDRVRVQGVQLELLAP